MLRKLLSNGFEVLALLSVLALAATPPARASQLFAFNYSLPGTGLTPMPVSASGFFVTTDLLGSSYTVTGVWGTWNGVAIQGVTAPGGFGGNDNLLFPVGNHVSTNGLSYTVAGAGDDTTGNVNIFLVGGGFYTELSPDVGVGTDFNLSQQTPEPGTATLLYTAIPVVLFLIRRRSMAQRRAS